MRWNIYWYPRGWRLIDIGRRKWRASARVTPTDSNGNGITDLQHLASPLVHRPQPLVSPVVQEKSEQISFRYCPL